MDPTILEIIPGESASVLLDIHAKSNCNDFAYEVCINPSEPYTNDNPCGVDHICEFNNSNFYNNRGNCYIDVQIPQDQQEGTLYIDFIATVSSSKADDEYDEKCKYITVSDRIQVNVVSGTTSDFEITASPTDLSIQQCESGTVDIGINWTMGTGDIQLNATGGIIGQGDDFAEPIFSPNPVSGDNSVLTLNVGPNAAIGVWPIKIIGTSGSIAKEIDLNLEIAPYENPWVSQSFGQFKTLRGVHFINKDFGAAVGDLGTIVRTIDGGTVWTQVDSPVDEDLYDIQFLNELTGFIVGENTILYTSDGGNIWANISNDTIYGHRSLFFSNESNGWIAGGHIYKTNNAGADWTIQLEQEFGRYWEDIAFGTETHGIAAGNNSASEAVIYYTTDSLNWLKSSLPSGIFNLRAISFANESVAYIGGYNGEILKSTDGGLNWTHISTIDGYVLEISFTDEMNGYSVSNKIYRTVDGGENWTEEIYNTRPFIDTYFLDNKTGYAVGQAGMILRRK